MLTARRAFTLLEIVAALIIAGILTAVLYPTVGAQLRGARSAALARQLDALREAITNYEDNVGQFPLSLQQLVASPTTGALDLCGNALSAQERNRWRGPYLRQDVSGDLPVGDFLVDDALIRVPPTTAGGQTGTLRLSVTGVDSMTAADLETSFDGSYDFSAGTVLWVPSTPPEGTLTFQMPIRGC